MKTFPMEQAATNKCMLDFSNIRKEFFSNSATKKLFLLENYENCYISGNEPLILSPN